LLFFSVSSSFPLLQETHAMVWWVRSDPCGIFSALLTILLVLYAQVTIVAVVLLPWYGFNWHTLAYTACSLLAIYSHCRAQFTDPGAVPKTRKPPVYTSEEAPRVLECKKCKIVKPAKASHCSTCARCILKQDHHCPWVNNCVAIFNQKYFILFLFYTAFCCLYSGILLVCRFVSCTRNLRMCSVSGLEAALCIINFIEALVFGLFVIIMLCDQIAAIWDTNHGDYDGDDDKPRKRISKYMALKHVFGEPFSWRWFVPMALPDAVLKEFAHECDEDERAMILPHSAPPSSSPEVESIAMAPLPLTPSSSKASLKDKRASD